MTIRSPNGDISYQKDGEPVLFIERLNRGTFGFDYSYDGEPLVFITSETVAPPSGGGTFNSGFFLF